MAVIDASDIPSLSLLYKLAKLTAAAPSSRPPRTLLGPTSLPTPSKALNDRIALIRGDITTLGVDAIVNAANRSLLGGGGVDGAIHRAAGPGLFDECRKLNGCATGSARITGAYKLPCRRVIHAVGPIYDDEDDAGSERLLASCYTTSLNVAVNNECRTIAFSALSTGIYGYPSRRAAAAALGAIRAFLTSPEAQSKVDKVVLVTFERKDWDAYVEMLPLFFPPVPEHPTGTATETSSAEQKQDVEDEAKLEAEAQAVANELPSPPKIDPDDAEHVDKKQRPNEP